MKGHSLFKSHHHSSPSSHSSHSTPSRSHGSTPSSTPPRFSDTTMVENIEISEPIILKWELPSNKEEKFLPLLVDDRKEAKKFLEAVTSLQSAMHYYLKLSSSTEKIVRAQCLSSMGLKPAAVSWIVNMHPQLLTADPYSDIYPILHFLLHTVRLPFPEVSKSISRCPRILISNLEAQLVPTFKFLTELGFVGHNKLNSQMTLLLVSSVESTLMPKIEFFGRARN